jgi:phosphoglycolate phosphatase
MAQPTRLTFFFSDLDGTLEDSREDMTRAAQRVRAHFGLPAWPDDRITPNVNRGMTELYLACFTDLLEAESTRGVPQAETLERIRLAYEADYLAHVADHTRLYEGMAETLRQLSERGKVIVITNKPEKISRALLDALGVGSFITDVMGGDSCAETKPSPLPLRIAAARHGYVEGRDDAYMMGDTLADIRCGRAFGAKTIWCAYGYLTSTGDERPDFTATSPREIPEIVRSQL